MGEREREKSMKELEALADDFYFGTSEDSFDDVDLKLVKKHTEMKVCKSCGEPRPLEAFRGGSLNCSSCRSKSGVKGKKFHNLMRRASKDGKFKNG